MINDNIVSVEEAGQILKISKTSVRSLIKNKHLKAVKINKKILIHKQEIKRFSDAVLKELL